MSDNVGLPTPRGSGTSGYVQRNLSHVKPRDRASPYSTGAELPRHRARQPDPSILEHERRRRIEVRVFELRDRLEDEGVAEDEIEAQTGALRERLEAEDRRNADRETDARKLRPHQVHDLAKAKIEETEKLRRALGISKDYEEGGHWRRQEEQRRRRDGGAAAEEKREMVKPPPRGRDDRDRERERRAAPERSPESPGRRRRYDDDEESGDERASE